MSDPFTDFDRYEEECSRWESKRPRCAYCGERIYNDVCYEFDSDLVCPDCLEDYLKAHKGIMLELAMGRAEEYYEVLTENKEET